MADCQALCSTSKTCKAIEFKQGSTSHCELWSEEPRATNGNTHFTCLKSHVTIAEYETGDAEVVYSKEIPGKRTYLIAGFVAASASLFVALRWVASRRSSRHLHTLLEWDHG